jgi:hypothetical protein
MDKRNAIKLHKGDEVVDKKTGETIHVICAFEDFCPEPVVMIEGTGERTGYGHWPHFDVK